MTRVSVLVACALISASRPAAAAEKPDERPNVLLVVIDTLRADHLGAYGYKRPTSPRIDALAASGTRFANARATSSWTSPSVASILTGLYPENHGVQLPSSRLSTNAPTLAASFRAAGYRTTLYSANPAFVSARQGFDNGFEELFVLHSGPVASEDEAADVIPGAGPGQNVRVAAANQVTDMALDWLASHVDKPQPFFLYLHYFDPHAGYYPPAEFAERFGVAADSPMLAVDQHRYWKKAPDPATLAVLQSLYDGEIAFTDFQLGRILDALPKSRPTVILLTSDHGEEFMEHGGTSHGHTLWEEMLRVPLIVAGAGARPGVVAEPVVLTDIWPTLAEMAGVPAPTGVDGISLAPAVREGKAPPARPIFADLLKAQEQQAMIHRHAVLDGSWKLLENIPEGHGLYDLGSDPGEKRDALAQNPKRAEPLEKLLSAREAQKKNPVTAPTVALSDEDKARMRALGYEPD